MKKSFLDSIDVKSPCSESWEEMTGNDEVRFCSHCAKDVHNLSEMTRAKAEKVIKESNGKLCVRYVKTPNGKLVTAPPKFTQITRRATIAAGVLATSLALSALTYAQSEPLPKDKIIQTKKENSTKDETKQGFSTISGTIMDANGAVVPNAKVTLREIKTDKIRITQTNEVGNYEFNKVEPGIYELLAESLGFKRALVHDVNALKGLVIQQNMVFEVGETTIGVVALAEEPLIKVEDSKLSEQLIEQRQILEFPLNGRPFTTLGLVAVTRSEEKHKKPAKPKKKKN
jgi:hypothetical protein